MRRTHIDAAVESTADRQHGAFSRAQAFQAGASERFIKRRLAEGIWSRVAPAVYVLSRSEGTWRRQCKAAELGTPGSAIAGPAAAALHGLTGFRPGPIELVVPPTSNTRHALAICHRYAGARTTVVDAIATTTIAQTLVDIAARVPPWCLDRAMDDAILGGRLTVDDLVERQCFYEGGRRPGSALIRAMVDERTADGWMPPESELEALLWRVLLALPGRPRLTRQASLPWRTATPGRVDVLLADHDVVVEADGRRWHARLADFDKDRWRDNEAAASGFTVLRFSWVHLTHARRDVLDLISRTIATRASAA